MRKLISVAILAAALPNLAFAEEKTQAQTDLEAAIAACADAACKDDALKQALIDGMDLTLAIDSALVAGMDAEKARAVAKEQGSTDTDIQNAISASVLKSTKGEVTAGGGPTNGTGIVKKEPGSTTGSITNGGGSGTANTGDSPARP